MTHEEAELLLAAHAVGELAPGEEASLRRHLLACAECRRVGATFRDVSDRLALSVDDVQPPPGLRTRLLAQVYAEASGRRVAAPPAPVPLWRRAWERIPARRSLTVAGAVGTLVAAAAAVLLAGHERVQAPSGPGHFTVASCGLSGEPRACGSLTYDAATHQGVLTMTGLGDIPTVDGRPTAAYEVWLVRADHSAQAAAFLSRSPDGRSWTGAMQGDMDRVVAVATTIEPPQGSAVPSGTEVLRIDLPRPGSTASA